MIIGIGGCSNSGKSKLAKEISDFYMKRMKSVILCQDDFVNRRDYLTLINGHVNWELPSTIKFEKYLTAVSEANQNYQLVICEGLFAFWFKQLNRLYDKQLFLNIDEQTFIERKQSDLRWGKEPDWYIDHIWQSHLKYGQYSGSKQNTLFLDATKVINLSKIIDFIGV